MTTSRRRRDEKVESTSIYTNTSTHRIKLEDFWWDDVWLELPYAREVIHANEDKAWCKVERLGVFSAFLVYPIYYIIVI